MGTVMKARSLPHTSKQARGWTLKVNEVGLYIEDNPTTGKSPKREEK